MSSTPPEKIKQDIEKSDGSVDAFDKLLLEEQDHDIKFRTLSWQKVTALLFAEYVCLATLALSWSWSVLGWGLGIGVTMGLAAVTIYTSYVLWQFTMAHPEVRDICDIASLLFPQIPRVAYEITAVFLLLNNIFLMGFHIFTGAKILNTLSDSSQCTAVFQFIIFIMAVVFSIPRTLKHISLMSILSAVSMSIAILLFFCFVGTEDHPGYGYGGNWPTQGAVTAVGTIPAGTTFVSGLNGALNITFLWVGQILYPSFIAEMKNPRDFPKALAALSVLEVILFMVCAAVGFAYMGQYSTAPAIGSLQHAWARKAAFAFVLPPTLIIGSIYSNVAAQYLFRRVLGGTRHLYSHTAIGWGVWLGIVIVIWAIAFVLGNVIPSMGDFLAIMSSLFDSFFGFIFWACAYVHLNKGRLFAGPKMITLSIINVIIFCCGLFMLGPGLYTSVDAITQDYAGGVNAPFSCKSNSL